MGECVKVAILMPVFPAHLEYETAGALLVLQEEMIERGIANEIVINPGNPYLPKARNELAASFLRSDADVSLWLDADVGYGPHAAFQLLDRPEAVVAGIYPKKVEPPEFPVVICTDPDGYPVGRGGLIEAVRIPMGFTMIRREVFEALMEARPDLEYTNNPSDAQAHPEWNFFPAGAVAGKWVGEDYGFSDLWRSVGGQLWVDPDINFIHKGAKRYFANYDQFLRQLPKHNPGKLYDAK